MIAAQQGCRNTQLITHSLFCKMMASFQTSSIDVGPYRGAQVCRECALFCWLPVTSDSRLLHKVTVTLFTLVAVSHFAIPRRSGCRCRRSSSTDKSHWQSHRSGSGAGECQILDLETVVRFTDFRCHHEQVARLVICIDICPAH